MMAGATQVLTEAGCPLIGGHSCEGAELSLGFAVAGAIPSAECMRKGGLREGHALLLTKPIGTGALFAANMRGQAAGAWVAAALRSMTLSNQPAAAVRTAAAFTHHSSARRGPDGGVLTVGTLHRCSRSTTRRAAPT
jgi:selenide,water dikinase